jgi:hypothetical protein
MKMNKFIIYMQLSIVFLDNDGDKGGPAIERKAE